MLPAGHAVDAHCTLCAGMPREVRRPSGKTRSCGEWLLAQREQFRQLMKER